MIKVIAFDFGGVIGSDADQWNTTFKPVLDLTGLTSQEMVNIWEKHWSKLKIGAEHIQNYWTETSIKNKVDPEKIRETYNNCITARRDMLELAKSLKAKYKIVILSNDAKDWMDAKIRRFGLDKIFETIYSSADLHMAKPDKEIFDYVLSDLGVKPSELIFIDNQLNNYMASNAVGINTILFTDIEKLKSDLKKIL